MIDFKPKDVIAMFAITVFAVMRLRGIDSSFDAPLYLILGYYFVKRENGKDNGH